MVVTAHQSDMEPPSGLSRESMGTNTRNSENLMEDSDIEPPTPAIEIPSYSNTRNAEMNQKFVCDKGSDKQISQSSTNFNYCHTSHKSDGYAFDNNPGYCNHSPEESICDSSTDGDSEICQISNRKDDRHVQVSESLKKVTKYFSHPYAKKFRVAMGSAKSTIGQIYNILRDENRNDFGNNYSANMNYVRSSYKTTEELEREEQEKQNRERQLLSQITAHNSKKLTPPLQSSSSALLSGLALSVTPSPNIPKFSPGTSVATLIKEAKQRNSSQHNLRARKDIDYKALNNGKSPVKKQPPVKIFHKMVHCY